MTVCAVYVGLMTDARFNWDQGDWNGNVPAAISPEFPPANGHYNSQFHAWVKERGVESKQTDYGGWVAKVTKSQIGEYLRYCYDGKEDLPWVKEKLIAVREWTSGLDEGVVYALVATEF